jgi:hypothetical protein
VELGYHYSLIYQCKEDLIMGLDYKITITRRSNSEEYQYSGRVVSYIEISNTKDRLYQTGTLILVGIPNIFVIGDYVEIEVNSEDIFIVNISELKVTGLGVRNTEIKLVGMTYNLWKYELTVESSHAPR